jgi:hypothetical protein
MVFACFSTFVGAHPTARNSSEQTAATELGFRSHRWEEESIARTPSSTSPKGSTDSTSEAVEDLLMPGYRERLMAAYLASLPTGQPRRADPAGHLHARLEAGGRGTGTMGRRPSRSDLPTTARVCAGHRPGQVRLRAILLELQKRLFDESEAPLRTPAK